MESVIINNVLVEINERINELSEAWEHADDELEAAVDPETARFYQDREVNYATKCLELMRLRRKIKEFKELID